MEGGCLGGSCKSYFFLIRMYFLFASVFNSGAVSILVLSFFSSGFSGGDGSEDEGGDGTGGSGGREDMAKCRIRVPQKYKADEF